jgi:hypothetical protein
MYKIKFEIEPGLNGYIIHNGVDTFTLEVAQQLLEEYSTHPYSHTIEEETA